MSDVLAQPILDSRACCTHLFGLDDTIQVYKPVKAGPAAIRNAKRLYVDRFGKPKLEKQLPDGVALTWVTTETAT